MRADWMGRVPAAEFLAADARRLADARPSVAAAILSDSSVSVGVRFSLPAATEERVARRGWTIHRRSTGGTALLHRPGDLLWSLVLPRSDPRVGRDFVRAYARFGRPITDALSEAGVRTVWGRPEPLSSAFCLFGPNGEVLRAGDRILGGAAQHLTGRALLHHGAVHRTADRELLSELFGIARPALDRHLGAVGEIVPSIDLERVGRDSLERAVEPGG